MPGVPHSGRASEGVGMAEGVPEGPLPAFIRRASRPQAGRLRPLEVSRMDLLAVTIFGITFSGTLALGVAVVVVVVVVLAWFLMSRLRR